MKKPLCLLALLIAIASCSSDTSETPSGGNGKREIQVSVGLATRANTFDSQASLDNSFTLSAYLTGTATPYFAQTPIVKEGANWLFAANPQYWPAAVALDFVAWMPATPPNYIENLTYTAGELQFSCANLPTTPEGQSSMKEFVCAILKEQSYEHTNTYSPNGIGITLQHPFACIRLRWANAPYSHADITLNSITLKNLRTGGTCTFSGTTATWTDLTGSANFTTNTLQEYNDELTSFLVVPQDFAGEMEVNATWNVWGEPMTHTLRTTVADSWQAGQSYTYTFNITESDLVVNNEKFTEQW